MEYLKSSPNVPTLVLGIESSCDETAAAVLRFEDGARPEILSDVIHTQIDLHMEHGGVVPEIAARSHVALADKVVAQALDDAGVRPDMLAGVAATSGPGLIGGVMVGMMTGKAIAQVAGCPFVPINHLEGHALSPLLAEDLAFPYLLLLVSGGHCQFVWVEALGQYTRLGTTLDDAVGEAFDKTARILGLGFPGGPAVEALAGQGDETGVKLPRPLLDRPGLDMSFAGLKTAVLRRAQTEPITPKRKADICASFQAAVRDVLLEKTRRALAQTGARQFVMAGGVAANQMLRTHLTNMVESQGARAFYPPMRYCTDNAAMIALAGGLRLLAGQNFDDSMGTKARPRWPLGELVTG